MGRPWGLKAQATSCVTDVGRMPTLHWGVIIRVLLWGCCYVGIHTVKGFSIVNKAEVDVFLELSCFFDDPGDVGNLISGSSAFSKTSLNIRKFTVHILLIDSDCTGLRV